MTNDIDTETAADNHEIAVSLKGVGKDYGSVTALGSVDLDIRKGEFFSLLGPSGCGKTTTLALIGGFEEATRGSLSIDGKAMIGVPSHRRQVNTVFQSYALFPHMTVGENVAFGLKMKNVPAAERRAAVQEILRLVSLEGYEERRPQQLSGGQRQRVAVARALVNKPSVLLLDEPLGALDLKLRKHMQMELTKLQRQVGITFVYVTHDQEEALSMSDRIAVMDHGKVLQVGTPAEIYDTPADRFVMEFIGTPNTFHGKVVGSNGQSLEVAIDGIGTARGQAREPLAVNSDVILLVRPERIILTPQTGGAAENAATITRISNIGFVSHFDLRLANGTELLVYRLNETAGAGAGTLSEGMAVSVAWEEVNGRVFPASGSD